MPRLISVSHTEQAVVERRKTVTRRLGWEFLKPGDRLTLCRKTMGLRKGQHVVRLAEVEVVSVRRECINDMTPDDIEREGVPFLEWDRYRKDAQAPLTWAWARWFCATMKVTADTEITRIEWRYLS